MRDSILEHPGEPGPELEALISGAYAARDARVLAILLGARAFARRLAGAHGPALGDCHRAIAAARVCGDDDARQRALVTRAMIRLELGDVARAREDLADAGREGPMEPRIALAAGIAAHHCGEVIAARRLFAQVAEATGAPANLQVMAWNNLADVVQAQDPQLALAHLDRAEEILHRSPSYLSTYVTLTRALTLARAGRVGEALRLLNEATTAQALAEAGLVGEYEAELAAILGSLRLLDEARAAAARSLAEMGRDGAQLMRADAEVSAGRLARDDGDVAAARTHLAAAHDLYVRHDRPAGVAISAAELLVLQPDPDPVPLAGHAAALAGMGLVREAANTWFAAAAAAQDRGSEELARGYWRRIRDLPAGDPAAVQEALARLALSTGDLDEVAGQVERALALLDARAALAAAPDLRHRMAAGRARFEQLDRIAWRARPPAERLDRLLRTRPPGSPAQSEAGHAPAGEAEVSPAGPGEAEVSPAGPGEAEVSPAAGTGEVAELRLQWRTIAQRLDSSQEDPQTLALLTRQLAETEGRLRVLSWLAPGSQRAAAPGGLAEVLAGPGRPDLLAVVRVGDRLEAILAEAGEGGEPARAASRDLGERTRLLADGAQLARALTRVATTGSAQTATAARVLAAQVDACFGELLQGTRPLLVLVDRGLEALPLGALPRLWGRSVAFASLAVTGGAAAGPAPVLDGATPVVCAAGPGLAAAGRESEVVAAQWPRTRIVRRAGELTGAMPQVQVAHVAAHATLRWDNPWQSQILLDDGPVTLGEVVEQRAGRPLAALVLAACSLGSAPTDTALTGAIPMLTETAARQVVAAAIPLPDAHGPWIAAALHERLRAGGSAADGLREARSRLGDAAAAEPAAWAALSCLLAYVGVP